MTVEQFGTSSALYHRMHYNDWHQLYDVRLGTGTVDNLNDPLTKNRGALHLLPPNQKAHANRHVARAIRPNRLWGRWTDRIA